jgi:hypothetical protein
MPANDDAHVWIRALHEIDDLLKIVSDLLDWHATKRVVDPKFENEDVDPGFEMSRQATKSVLGRAASLAGI